MATSTSGSTGPGTKQQQHKAQQMSYSDIAQPGAYIRTTTGELFRVPEDSIAEGRSPRISLETSGDDTMILLSSNPWETISQCRHLAADADIQPNF